MKKFLAVLMAAALFPLAVQAESLVGHWTAKRSAVALGGVAEFRDDGSFSLQPDGAGAAEGKYTLEGNRLVMRLNSSPQFPAEGIVEFSKKGSAMSIQYAKGPAQEFTRTTVKKVSKK